ncbi:MAG: hypothetical protein R6V20_08350 [Desulfobia sp.]
MNKTNDSTVPYSTRELLARIEKSGFEHSRTVDSKDFIRIMVSKNDIPLQVDLVNDRVKRFGNFNYHKNYRLDNPLNILSNKISAVIGRDDPKDIFDIYLISLNCTFNWSHLQKRSKRRVTTRFSFPPLYCISLTLNRLKLCGMTTIGD